MILLCFEYSIFKVFVNVFKMFWGWWYSIFEYRIVLNILFCYLLSLFYVYVCMVILVFFFCVMFILMFFLSSFNLFGKLVRITFDGFNFVETSFGSLVFVLIFMMFCLVSKCLV